MKTAYGYIRVSTPKQGEGVSLIEQKRLISEFANQHGFQIVEWFAEQQTAAKAGRKKFNQMLKQLNQNRADAVILHKIDRSARNLQDWSKVTALLDLNVDVRFAVDNLDMTTRSGRLAADLQAVVAADFIRNQRDETRKGQRGRLNQGLYPYRAPIGYLNEGRGKPKRPCPVKAPLVEEVFRRYASGQHSLKSLWRELDSLGLRNHNGGPVTLRGLATILHNPFYTGLIEIKRTGETFKGSHTPIISNHLYRRVQDVIAGKSGKKVTRHNHLYRGLFRCGHCDNPMTPERQKGHVYYRCQRPDCETKTVREEAIDAAVMCAYAHMQIPQETASALRERWLGMQSVDDAKHAAGSIKAQIVQNEQRMSRLTDLLIDGEISDMQHRNKKRELEQQHMVLTEQLEDLERCRPDQQKVEKFLELLTNLTELHKLGNPNEKRQMVEMTFSNRVVSGKNVDLAASDWIESAVGGDYLQMVTQIGPLLELLFPADLTHNIPSRTKCATAEKDN